jgi:hypothetical protein
LEVAARRGRARLEPRINADYLRISPPASAFICGWFFSG